MECDIARESGKMVLVDAVSSFAGETLDISGWGVDGLIGSANKCIRGVPGAAFVIVSDRFVDVIKRCKPRTYYSSLLNHLKAEDKDEPLFTPPVQVFYALREALTELLEYGVGARIDNYRRIAKHLRDGLGEMGIKFYIPCKL